MDWKQQLLKMKKDLPLVKVDPPKPKATLLQTAEIVMNEITERRRGNVILRRGK